MNDRLEIALYWGAACGGCDVAVLDTDEFVLDIGRLARIRLWPIAVDGKYSDIEALDDGHLDVAFFNGAVRNSENEAIAKMLRQKSKVMIAFGACAHLGGIPGLANQTTRAEIFSRAYLENPSIQSGNITLPASHSHVGDIELVLPVFYEQVYRLADVVDVDYYLPGCPPAPDQVKAAILAIVQGALPERGAVVGASERALCEDCTREKKEKKIQRFFRPHEKIQDPELCLLEQGFVCAGPATRSGCGVRCPDSGMPCRGCYGPPPKVHDQGAKLVSALSSVIDSKDPNEIDGILAELPDVLGYAYRFSLPDSTLRRSL